MTQVIEQESGEIRYASSGGANIAYQVTGDGLADLVYIGGWVTHIEVAREDPGMGPFSEALDRFARVVSFDKRGTGLSDRVPEAQMPTMEERMDDIRAVMDAVGLERASLLGFSEGDQLAMLFAATYPERTANLVIWGSYASMMRRPGYPWGWTPEQLAGAERLCSSEGWGTADDLGLFQPSQSDDEITRRWFARYKRMAASPGAALALLRMNAEMDVRGVLSAISTPTLILHRRGDVLIEVDQARYLAQHIPGARIVEFEGDDHWPWPSSMSAVVEEIEGFVTGARREPDPTRALATLLFTDIVGSTEHMSQLGDDRWRELLQRHNAMVRNELTRHRGREVKTTGDGFLAMFDGPARGIRCARAICDEARELGLDVRSGLHTGECELMGEDIGGMGVHIAARVAALARPSEVLVSRTVTDLVAGSGIAFESRGEQDLKGVPGAWELFAATS